MIPAYLIARKTTQPGTLVRPVRSDIGLAAEEFQQYQSSHQEARLNEAVLLEDEAGAMAYAFGIRNKDGVASNVGLQLEDFSSLLLTHPNTRIIHIAERLPKLWARTRLHDDKVNRTAFDRELNRIGHLVPTQKHEVGGRRVITA